MSRKEPSREIRKSCGILGLDPEKLTKQNILQAWKNQLINAPSVHPDLGDETEVAIILNTAKDVLLEWIGGDDPDAPAPIANNPTPSPLNNSVLKPFSDCDEQAS